MENDGQRADGEDSADKDGDLDEDEEYLTRADRFEAGYNFRFQARRMHRTGDASVTWAEHCRHVLVPCCACKGHVKGRHCCVASYNGLCRLLISGATGLLRHFHAPEG